jgi:hypothetical protein
MRRGKDIYARGSSGKAGGVIRYCRKVKAKPRKCVPTDSAHGWPADYAALDAADLGEDSEITIVLVKARKRTTMAISSIALIWSSANDLMRAPRSS